MFLPPDPPRGGRWSDHRIVINGIFSRAPAGCPWRDLPEGKDWTVSADSTVAHAAPTISRDGR